jgi:hypothetical protein
MRRMSGSFIKESYANKFLQISIFSASRYGLPAPIVVQLLIQRIVFDFPPKVEHERPRPYKLQCHFRIIRDLCGFLLQ